MVDETPHFETSEALPQPEVGDQESGELTEDQTVEEDDDGETEEEHEASEDS